MDCHPWGWIQLVPLDLELFPQLWPHMVPSYRVQGKLKEAEEMYQRVLGGYELTLGPDRISILMTVNNLGSLYSSEGKLEEAERMNQRALEGYEKA